MNLKLPKFEHRFISLAVLFVILVLIMPRTAKFGYDYKKGYLCDMCHVGLYLL